MGTLHRLISSAAVMLNAANDQVGSVNPFPVTNLYAKDFFLIGKMGLCPGRAKTKNSHSPVFAGGTAVFCSVGKSGLQRQSYGDLQGVAIGPGMDFPIVGGCDGFGHGQADSIPTGAGVAGGVRAVEPFEQPGQLPGGDRCRRCIAHGEQQRFALLFHREGDRAAGGGVFQGIVQQDVHQLLNRLFVPFQRKHGLYIA